MKQGFEDASIYIKEKIEAIRALRCALVMIRCLRQWA